MTWMKWLNICHSWTITYRMQQQLLTSFIHYLCTIEAEETVRICSASPVSDKFNLSSTPTLIFRSWKWKSGLIVFWINCAASLYVYNSPPSYLLLQFLCLHVSLTQIDAHIHTFIKKNWPMYITCLCKSDKPLMKAHWVCHPQWVAPRHDYTAQPQWM